MTQSDCVKRHARLLWVWDLLPVWLGTAARLHWGLPEPARATGDQKERLGAFRQVRHELRRRLGVVFRPLGS